MRLNCSLSSFQSVKMRLCIMHLSPSILILFHLQSNLMSRWASHMQTCTSDSFWHQHNPCFHVYDYGMNSGIDSRQDDNGDVLTQQITDSFMYLFEPDAIADISIAIATEVELIQQTLDDDLELSTVKRSLLANAEKLSKQYSISQAHNPLTIFPVAFSPKACNFQSTRPPNIVVRGFKDAFSRLYFENHDRQVISFGPFQGYNTIKQRARPSKDDFALSQGSYTATFCVGLKTDAITGRRHRQALQRCDSHQPYISFVRAIDEAMEADKIRFRFEPIFLIHFDQLERDNKTFHYLARNVIIPLCRVWDDRSFNICTPLLDPYPLDVFPLLYPSDQKVFPAIYSIFATVYKHAMNALTSRLHPSTGSMDEFFLTEAIANLERLSAQIFTGDLKQR